MGKAEGLGLWIPLAEWLYNTNQHSSTEITPFEALYGYPPPRLLTYIPGLTKVEVVEQILMTREQILHILKHIL